MINAKGFGGNNASTLLLSPAPDSTNAFEGFGSQKVWEHEQKRTLQYKAQAMSYDTLGAG